LFNSNSSRSMDQKSALDNITKAKELWKEGTCLLESGNFKESVECFDKVKQLNPQSSAFLWTRGIALFFVGKYKEGWNQFQEDMKENGSDYEEIFWRFLCMSMDEEIGFMEAQKQILSPKDKKDTRIPLSQLFDLYQGVGKEDIVLEAAKKSKTSEFYAYLYLCIFCLCKKEKDKSMEFIQKAVNISLDDFMYTIANHLSKWIQTTNM